MKPVKVVGLLLAITSNAATIHRPQQVSDIADDDEVRHPDLESLGTPGHVEARWHANKALVAFLTRATTPSSAGTTFLEGIGNSTANTDWWHVVLLLGGGVVVGMILGQLLFSPRGGSQSDAELMADQDYEKLQKEHADAQGKVVDLACQVKMARQEVVSLQTKLKGTETATTKEVEVVLQKLSEVFEAMFCNESLKAAVAEAQHEVAHPPLEEAKHSTAAALGTRTPPKGGGRTPPRGGGRTPPSRGTKTPTAATPLREVTPARTPTEQPTDDNECVIG